MNVEFKKSGQTLEWDGRFANLVEFAEAKGIVIDSPCRTGACGVCKLKLLSGRVTMETEDGLSDEDRAEHMILPCVAVPQTDLVLEA